MRNRRASRLPLRALSPVERYRDAQLDRPKIRVDLDDLDWLPPCGSAQKA